MSSVIGAVFGSLRILISVHSISSASKTSRRPSSGLADAGDELDGLVDHHRADRRAQHAEHATLGARRHHAGRRRLGVEVAVVGSVVVPEHADLAVEAVDRAPHVRLVQQHGRVVDQVAGGEVVGAVDDQVVAGEDVEHVVVVQARSRGRSTLTSGLISSTESRADSALGRPMSLWPWMIWRCRLDSSTMSNSTMPSVPTPAAARYSSAGEPRPPAPTHEHLGVLQPLLPGHRDVRDDQVAAVAAHLVDGQRLGRFDQRWQRHGLRDPSRSMSRGRLPELSMTTEPATFPASGMPRVAGLTIVAHPPGSSSERSGRRSTSGRPRSTSGPAYAR